MFTSRCVMLLYTKRFDWNVQKHCQRINFLLSEKGEISKMDLDTSFKYFLKYSGNILKNLEINQDSNFDPVICNVEDPNLYTKTTQAFFQFKTIVRTE